MKIWDIVKNVGAGIIREVVPGGGLIIGAVNELLPEDQKLPNSATGEQIGTALSKLPPDKQAEIMSKEFDVDMTQIRESNSTVRVMLESDAKNPHSTRPYIAKGAFHVVAFAVVVVVSIWAYGVFIKDNGLVKAVVDGWPFILAVIGPFIVLLHAYFGVLKQEHKNRLDAARGASVPSGIAGILSTLMGKK